MVKKTLMTATEIFVSSDGKTFTDEYECLAHEEYAQNMAHTHVYDETADGRLHSSSYYSRSAAVVVFDTYAAYKQYLNLIDYGEDSYDIITPAASFPAVFRYNKEYDYWDNTKMKKRKIRKLLKRA